MKQKEHPDVLFIVMTLLLLLGSGLLLVYSATFNEGSEWISSKWFRQIIFVSVGTVFMVVASLFPLRFYKSIAFPMYFVSLLLLLFLAFGGGHSSHGAGRWISLGGFRFQPSEFAKIAYLLAFAKLLENRTFSLNNLKGFITPSFVFVIPFLLILKQPDMSTALVYVAITLVGFYWRGLSLLEILFIISPIISVLTSMNKILWALFLSGLVILMVKSRLDKKLMGTLFIINIGAAFGTFMIWNKILKEHQRSRILTFIDPMRDPRGEGYQVIQSKVAIGSGGVSGKGFTKGSQTNLDFLPEEHTDFIFSVLGEQFGLLGTGFILFLFYFLLWNIIKTVTWQKEAFGNLLVVGIATLLGFHVVVNVAMTLGLMPVTGLPLPFLSYGGSFIMTCMILMGFVISVRSAKNDT